LILVVAVRQISSILEKKKSPYEYILQHILNHAVNQLFVLCDIASPYDTYFWKSETKQITLIAKITKYIQLNSNIMKRCILFSFLLMLVANSLVASTNAIYLYEDPKYPGPKPSQLRALSFAGNPVTATIDEVDLSVYFDEPVATATVIVYNSFNQVVEQIVVNTNTTSEVHIPAYLLDAGDYTLTVSYGTTIQKGVFQITE